MTKIEKKVADTILQQPQEIKVGKKKYETAPPSTATLILVSEAVSRLPQHTIEVKEGDSIAQPCLAIAKDCAPMGEIAAILILGAKGLTEVVKEKIETQERRFFGLIRKTKIVEVERTVDRKAELAKEILEDHTPTEVFNIITRQLSTMQLSDFFATTTFLIEINLLRQTKVVQTPTTAFGQSSQE